MARARGVLLGVLLCATLHQSTARQMDKCQLARELMRHGMPEHELADWLCLADHESRYDTGAVGRLNGDRTVDHGLFQISDLYWCDWSREEPQRSYRNLCRASCDDFRDDDIANDLACVRQIFDEHKRLQGNGFMAWVAWRNFCNGASMAEYSTSECDLHGAPSPTRRPAPVLVPAPDPPTSLLPPDMTNGHTYGQPSSNALRRTSQHNKSRLKPYRRGRTGWKAPSGRRRNQPVTWSPKVLKLISTTPAPPRGPAGSRPRRPSSSSGSFTSSSSFSSSPGSSSFYSSSSFSSSPASSSFYSSSSSSSSFSSSSGSQFGENIFLSGQPGFRQTPRPFVASNDQGAPANFLPPETSVGQGPSPYPNNVFLVNTRTSQSSPFPSNPSPPVNHPFKDNVFLGGNAFQQNAASDQGPAHPYPNNIFLGGSFNRATTASPPRPFGGSAFHQESGGSSQTHHQTRPVSPGPAFTRPAAAQNGFGSPNRQYPEPVSAAARPEQPEFTVTQRPTASAKPTTEIALPITTATTTTRRPTTPRSFRMRPSAVTETTTQQRQGQEIPSNTVPSSIATTRRPERFRPTTRKPQRFTEATTRRYSTTTPRSSFDRFTTTRRPRTTRRPSIGSNTPTTVGRREDRTQRPPTRGRPPSTRPSKPTEGRREDTTQRPPTKRRPPSTRPSTPTEGRREDRTPRPPTRRRPPSTRRPTGFRPTTTRRPITARRPSPSSETTEGIEGQLLTTTRRPRTRRPRPRRPGQRRRPPTTERPARRGPAGSRPAATTTERSPSAASTSSFWERYYAQKSPSTTVSPASTEKATTAKSLVEEPNPSSKLRISSTSPRPTTRRPARKRLPTFRPFNNQRLTVTESPETERSDETEEEDKSSTSRTNQSRYAFTPLPNPKTGGPFGTWASHGPGGRSWGFSFKG